MSAHGEEELIGVAYASDRSEAEMVKGLLGSAGIDSTVQQVGIDGTAIGIGWLNPAGGARRVMVRAVDAEAARAVLAEAVEVGEREDWNELADAPYRGESRREPRNYGLFDAYARIWLWSILAMGLAFGIFLLLRST